MNTLIHDFRYAVRLLIKRPVFTAIIIVSLSLGIGANTMIFSIVNSLLLKPLPYTDPDRLVMVWFTPPNRPAPNEPGGRIGATRRNCSELRERSRTLEIACFQYFFTNFGEDGPGVAATERLLGQQFTAEFSEILGVRPRLGRWFTVDEENFDADPVIVISHDQWQSRFNSSPDVLGRKVRVDGVITTVIGVMPEGFQFLSTDADYWSPHRNTPVAANSPVRFLSVPARLKNGVTLEQAQSEMDAMAVALAEELPATNKGWGARVETLREFVSAGTTESLITFQGAVAFVLLIACANVAGLLLARGVAQQKELAVRAALGSSRWRIIRQLLTESVVLGLLGGVFGFAIGWAGLQLFLGVVPPLGPVEITVDASVLIFTLVLSVATGLVFGILPALQVSRADVMDALRDNSRSATSGRARQNLRSSLVVIQVALAFVMLAGAGLMMKTFLRLNNVNFGFDQRNLVTFQIQFPRAEFRKQTALPNGGIAADVNPRLNLISEQIRERLSTIPGVESATATVTPPLAGGFGQYTFTIDGQQVAETGREALRAQWNAVFAGYFDTLKVPLSRGRGFTPQDSAGGTPVVIISNTMARRFWPNEDPIGKRIHVNLYNDPPREIVGIVGDVRQAVRQEEQLPQMYVPYAQMPSVQGGQGYMVITFVARSSRDLGELVPALRAAVAEVDRTQAMDIIQTAEDYASDQLQETQMYVMLFGVFGSIAVLLAIVGIYGIVAHSVSQRTAEIGVRVALGARSGDVLRVVLQRGLILIAVGLSLGVGAAIALTRVLRSVLWGVTPTDPLTFIMALAALTAIAVLACYVPARRALKIDPIIALRYEQ